MGVGLEELRLQEEGGGGPGPPGIAGGADLLCAPPLTVVLFISGEAAPAALPANTRRATFSHQTLQFREHHRHGWTPLSCHETALTQPQVGTVIIACLVTHTSFFEAAALGY